MSDVVAFVVNSNFIIALVAVLGTVAATCKWSYGKMSRYFEASSTKRSFSVRLAAVELAVKDVPAIKTAVDTLVADGRTNGGATAKDQNNRIERKLDQLLKDGR